MDFPIKHSSAMVSGMRIHWAELGTDSAHPPVVLLHGLSDSHLTWKRIAPALGVERRVLMPDFLGSGLSERPDASYELQWHAQMIADWLEQLGIREVDVVGHSFGGGVAQMLLLQQRIRIHKLALLASGGLGRDVGFWLRLATLPGVVEWFGQPFMGFGTRLTLRGLRHVLPKDELEQLTAMNSIDGTARAFARTVRDVIDLRGQRRAFSERAHELTHVPEIVVCWGDLDDIIPMKHGSDFAESLKGAVFHRFEGAGHYLHHERPEALAETLRSFLIPVRAELAPLSAASQERVSLAAESLRVLVGLRTTLRERARSLFSRALAGVLRASSPARGWLRRLLERLGGTPKIGPG
jgi:pimeloyl-ACP methyl ester carboxylesterase